MFYLYDEIQNILVPRLHRKLIIFMEIAILFTINLEIHNSQLINHTKEVWMVAGIPFPGGTATCCCCAAEPGLGCSVLPLGSWCWSDAWEALVPFEFPEDKCWTLAKTGYKIPIEPRDESEARPTDAGTAATTVLMGMALTCGSLLREFGSTAAVSCWPEFTLLEDSVPICPWGCDPVASLRENSDPDYKKQERGNKKRVKLQNMQCINKQSSLS